MVNYFQCWSIENECTLFRIHGAIYVCFLLYGTWGRTYSASSGTTSKRERAKQQLFSFGGFCRLKLIVCVRKCLHVSWLFSLAVVATAAAVQVCSALRRIESRINYLWKLAYALLLLLCCAYSSTCWWKSKPLTHLQPLKLHLLSLQSPLSFHITLPLLLIYTHTS